MPGSSFFKEEVNHLIRLHFAREKETIDEAISRLWKVTGVVMMRAYSVFFANYTIGEDAYVTGAPGVPSLLEQRIFLIGGQEGHGRRRQGFSSEALEGSGPCRSGVCGVRVGLHLPDH